MGWDRRMPKKRTVLSLVVIILIISILTNVFFMTSIIEITQIASANPGNVDEDTHSSSTLTVTVTAPMPWIRWYDFRETAGGSRRNAQVDINNQYKFCVNITQNSTWADVDYVNITAWYDQNNEAGSSYNSTSGGNLNMFLQYKNTTGTAAWSLKWPDDEVTFSSGNCAETRHNSSCHNLTFAFTPLYQVRWAGGDGSWSNTTNTTNDGESWNFKIQVTTNNSRTAYVKDEYGIYRYSDISSAGNPSMTGAPASKATASAITVTTRANANFSLHVNVITLDGPGSSTMANTTIGVAGGDLAETNFGGSNPLYIYGGASSYKAHDINTYERSASTTFHCDIPYGQATGQYTSTVWYHLVLQTS